MNRSYSLKNIFLLLFSFACIVYSQKPLKKIDYTIGHIHLDMKVDSLTKMFGTPNSVISEYNPVLGDTLHDLHYKDISFSICDSLVFSISFSSKIYNTHRGVRVGDTKSKVLQLYGKPFQEFNSGYVYEDLSQSGAIIQFQTQMDTIKKIYIGYTAE